MMKTQAETQIRLQNILYLTDFSGASEAALPFAVTLARAYGANVHALHILLPTPYPYAYSAPGLIAAALEAEEENAQAEMQKVDSQLTGLQHETDVERGTRIWPEVEQAIQEDNIDLVVVGTHGRTGANKLMMGSVAEEIFRRSPVPVLTVGPNVRSGAHEGGRFHRVLFATDLTPESLARAPYAVSLAQENQALLLLLLVMPKPAYPSADDKKRLEMCTSEAMQCLSDIVPDDANLEFSWEAVVEYGEPAERIVEVAKQRGVDLIVLGVRKATHMDAAVHLGSAIAHKVVAHAPCPVLTARA
ncbi:MAG: universal stress protein [Candidatus Acidiferrales bacterium]|jgi:nucleotide-binding universal stress UspA family protein